MDRLERHYLHEAHRFGIELKVCNTSSTGMASNVKAADAVVIFTGKASHRARNEAMPAARSMKIAKGIFKELFVKKAA
jgi:hypothetical protein